jgi:ribosomal-protein-alanine N-acetyltransferase
MKEIKTGRLKIIPMSPEQFKDLAQSPQEDEAAKAVLLDRFNASIEDPKNRLWYTCWQIVLRADLTVLGSLSFRGPVENGCVALDIEIDPAVRSRGYATEAVGAMVRWAFSHQTVFFVTAETKEEHPASMRVLEKNEFVRVGTSENGLHWCREKPESSWMTIFMGMGLCLGIALSGSEVGTGIALGLCLGLAIGISFDSWEKATRKKMKEAMKQADIEA